MLVRSMERIAALCPRCFSACRARFLAWGEFANVLLLIVRYTVKARNMLISSAFVNAVGCIPVRQRAFLVVCCQPIIYLLNNKLLNFSRNRLRADR
jgi:hypothetical protein